jgi:hypothetical protein
VEEEKDLVFVNKLELMAPIHAIQPNAQYLFRKTIELQIVIHVSNKYTDNAASATNSSPDPFAAIHVMSDLQKLGMRIHESVRRVDLFTPSLLKLRELRVDFFKGVQFGPAVFDHLVKLEEFCLIRIDPEVDLEEFETGLTPLSIKCIGVKLLKLTSPRVATIETINTTGMVESLYPLVGLKDLKFAPNVDTDLSVLLLNFSNIRYLSLLLSDLSQVDRGQLSCLANVRTLKLKGLGAVNAGEIKKKI